MNDVLTWSGDIHDIFKRESRGMKNKKLIALIISAATSCSSVYAATLPANEVGSYILAMNTMSPITAKYTIQYKQAVEQKCNTVLGVEQLNSTAFTNVVQAMVSSETVDRMGLDAAGGSLQDTLSMIGKNVTCRGRLRERAKSYAKALANDILR
ncbi:MULTISPECIES: hypothetical protein [Enterobacterales]